MSMQARAVTYLPEATLEPRRRGPRLYRAEFAKLTTTGAWWTLTVVSVLTVGLDLIVNTANAHNAIANAVQAPDFTGPGLTQAQVDAMLAQWRSTLNLHDVLNEVATSLYTSGRFLGVLIITVFAAMMVAGEFHHQTATATFLGAPRRSPVIAAKFAAALTIGAALWLVTTAADLLVGVLVLRGEGYGTQLGDASVLRSIALGLPLYLCWAVFGVGLGALLRTQLQSVAAAAVLYLLVGTLWAAICNGLANWLHLKWITSLAVAAPQIASDVMISQGPFFDSAPPAWVGALVLAAYAIGTPLVGTAAIRRHDIT
jgi:ABC-type transport system involved in multi-copper enzyme maturation permease subunit